jgi:hypothetical protein
LILSITFKKSHTSSSLNSFSILTKYYFLLVFTTTTLTVVNIKITQTHLRFSPGKHQKPQNSNRGLYEIANTRLLTAEKQEKNSYRNIKKSYPKPIRFFSQITPKFLFTWKPQEPRKFSHSSTASLREFLPKNSVPINRKSKPENLLTQKLNPHCLGFGKTPGKIPSSVSLGPSVTLRRQLPPQQRPTHQKFLILPLPLPISQSPYTVQILMTHPKVKTEGAREMEVKIQ